VTRENHWPGAIETRAPSSTIVWRARIMGRAVLRSEIAVDA